MLGMLTLNVKNAINSAPWRNIMLALQDKGVPRYLCHLLENYFDNRSLIYESEGVTTSIRVTAGVP